MGVKYRIDFRDRYNQLCRVDISPVAEYTGEIIPVRSLGDNGCTISWDCSDQEPYETIINSKVVVTLWQQENMAIDIQELRQAQDRQFKVQVYLDNNLEFSGFLVPDGIKQMFQQPPFEVTLTATDGLMLLDNIEYLHDNLDGGRCILNYMRRILFASTLLDLPLPIRWVNTLINEEYPLETDVFSGSITWADRGDGYTDVYGNRRSCLYILEGLLQSMGCRIFQAHGRWNIYRINDIVTGVFKYMETPATTSGFEIIEGPEIDVNKTIRGANDEIPGDYSFVDENAVLMTAKGLGSATVTYEQDQRDNILPNGNMDIVLPTISKPIQWKLIRPEQADFETAPSLSAAAGSSVKIINNLILGSTNIFTMEFSLPIDTDILYTYINFGFKFSIASGANVNADGYIQWGDLSKFRLQLNYLAGDGVAYYLNEFGFWTTTQRQIELDAGRLGPLKMGDVAQVDFNANQDIKIPLPVITPIGRTTYPSLSVNFNLQPNFVMYLDDVYLRTDTNSDVYKASVIGSKNYGNEDYTLKISSSHNGFYFSNLMSNYGMAGREKFYTDGRSSGTLTEVFARSVLRNRSKPSDIFEGSILGKNFEYGSIFNIKTLEGKKFLPLKASWNIETSTIMLTAMENRDEDVSISVSHYGTNDKTVLSN